MSADSDEPQEFELPTTDAYREEHHEVTTAELPDSGYTLPVYQTAPGRILEMVDNPGLTRLIGEDEGQFEDMDEEEAVEALGDLQALMKEDVIPNIATERTNLDAIHWGDDELESDPKLETLDLSQLTDPDLGALMASVTGGGDEQDLEQFQG